MLNKEKIIYLDSAFTKAVKADGEDQSIYIEGYASTNDVDRSRDVVSADVWEAGIQNYLKNPIILAYHNHDEPAGEVVEHRIDAKGLWVKARISAASEIYGLVKDNVLKAFSIGFRILDAEYNSMAELFIIKEVELMEISVVSVPCNQEAIFNLAKSFETAEQCTEFKQLFAPQGNSAKELNASEAANNTTPKKESKKMDEKELQALLAATAKSAAEDATKSVLEAQAAEKAKAAADAKEKADFDAAVKAAVAAQTPSTTGAEKLMADLEKKINDSVELNAKSIENLQGELKAKAAEVEALQKSKMTFGEGNKAGEISYADKEKAVLLAAILRRPVAETKFAKDLIEKAGPHVPSATWELEVSMNMEAEVRRKLVVAPLLRSITMQTNVMTIPVNPEAGAATWVTNAQFGTTASAGAAQIHQLKEITLNAYKVATTEYMNYEEEEDSLLVLLPIVRDAMIRRVARAMDKAYLMGAGSGADPVKGLAIYDATSVVTPTNTGAATIAQLRNLRKDLGAWGLDPAEVTYVVSTDIYYDLLDDTLFQTVDKIGDRATLLTGQIGSIANSPVLVSAELPTKAGGAATATTNIGAIAFASANFIAGNQRGLRFDTQELVETQRRVMVASLRTGLTQTTTNIGQGVSTLRWS